MRNLEGESDRGLLRAFFDRRLKFEFHGSRITSDAGLLAYRELDEALGLTTLAGDVIADSRTGKNGWHGIIGLLRQSVYGRLAGYEDVNDADRLGRDPAMRWIVGGRAVERGGASTSQMGRFETELLATNDNLAALADLLGIWIDQVTRSVCRRTKFFWKASAICSRDPLAVRRTMCGAITPASAIGPKAGTRPTASSPR